MSRRVLAITICLVSFLTIFLVYFGFIGKNNKTINSKTEAANGTSTVDTQDNWQSGESIVVDSTSTPGSIKIPTPTVESYEANDSQIDLGDMWTNIVDESLMTGAQFTNVATPDGIYYLIDFKINVNFNKALVYTIWNNPYPEQGDPEPISIVAGIDYWNGSTWTNVASGPLINNDWTTYNFSDSTGSKIRIRHISGNSTGAWDGIREFEPFYGSTELYDIPTSLKSVHTSSSTQLDAGAHDTVNWTTFVPDGTNPNGNTSMAFRFRTSPDSTTWSAWSASTPYSASISLAGLTQQRYLQVETTLTNTDGASTPTLNSYTANYDYIDAPAETCSDGIQNQDETGVDCGGSICDACPVAPTCSDGSQNGDETGPDCGGSCPACEVPPTCSDTIQNGNETGPDCGGSCPACAPDEPDPTCSDNIQNGDETGVDCGGSCGACSEPYICPAEPVMGCYAKAQDDVDSCIANIPETTSWQDRNTASEACRNNYCSELRECEDKCGSGNDAAEENVYVLTPNGGESYQLTKQMTINWAWGVWGRIPNLSKGEKSATNDAPIGVVLSTDGGRTYDKFLEMLFPKNMPGELNNTNNSYTQYVAQRYGGIKPYTSYHAYDPDFMKSSGYYSQTLNIPDSVSLVSDNVRIKLEPVIFNCAIMYTPDESDNNFKITAGPVTPPTPSSISISASPDEAYLQPSQTQQYSATVINQEGVDITASCLVTWSMQTATAGSINTSGLLTASGTAGTWSNAVRATANCSGRSDFELLTFVTTNEARRLEYAWANPWSTNVKDPVKDAAFDVWGYDQFGLRLTSANYSFSLLDSRIGSIPTNGRAVNIATSNNYGCYPNKIKGTASYNGVEKSAFGSISIFPADYALNSSGTGCSGEKISLAEKIFAAITGVKGASAATGQVFTYVSYGATRYHRPGQITQFAGVPRDQLGNYVSGIPVQYILKNPSAGQLSSNGIFIATTTTGNYFGAVEVKATQGDKVITRTFDVIVTTAVRQARSILTWGPTGSSELTTNRILKMWKGSSYTFYSQLIDQFGDVISTRTTLEDVSGQNLVNIEGYNTLTANNTEGSFSNALKTTYDIDKINQSISREEDKIDGSSPTIYLTLDINDKNNDPKACIKAGDKVCDPLDPNCTTPCTGEDCVTTCTDCNPPCIGPLCDVEDFFDDISGATKSLIALLAALVGIAMLLLTSLLSAITNILPFLNNGGLFSFFMKGKDKKNAKAFVYDAFSGLPIPFANILLLNQDKSVSSIVESDRDGKFALPVDPGVTYSIMVDKYGYSLFDNEGSEKNNFLKYELKFSNNYLGDLFTVQANNYFFDKNVPLVPNTDAAKLVSRTRLVTTLMRVLVALNWVIIAVGLAFSITAVYYTQSVFNICIIALYVLLFSLYLIKYFLLSGKGYGIVKSNGQPVELAIVRALRAKDNKLIKTVVSDRKGRFGLALSKGYYKVFISKAGFKQERDIDLIVKSNLKPAHLEVELKEIGLPKEMGAEELTETNREDTQATESEIPNDFDQTITRGTLESAPPATESTEIENDRYAHDASEIIENFGK